jgi:GxxExxY protein
MIRMKEDPKIYDLCGEIIGAAMKAHSALGPGFLESVYQNALIGELRKIGFKAEAERPISVRYDGQIVGAFTADVLVNDSVIVELKANQSRAKAHEVQLVNYLTATGLDEGVLLNFGTDRLEFKKKFRLPRSEANFVLKPFC